MCEGFFCDKFLKADLFRILIHLSPLILSILGSAKVVFLGCAVPNKGVRMDIEYMD